MLFWEQAIYYGGIQAKALSMAVKRPSKINISMQSPIQGRSGSRMVSAWAKKVELKTRLGFCFRVQIIVIKMLWLSYFVDARRNSVTPGSHST
jgi:hypothetical protein